MGMGIDATRRSLKYSDLGGYCGRVAVEEVGVLGHGKLDDAVASQPRIKIDATRRSLKYSDLGRFLATPEKRKKTGIDQMLTSACCPRQYEHTDIKRVA